MAIPSLPLLPLMEGTPHALVLPYPAQSHVISLLELSYCLADRGFKVTFLNTEFNHSRLLATLPKERAYAASDGKSAQTSGRIRLASIPDGLGQDEDRKDVEKAVQRMMEIMPGCLEEFILYGEERFTCFVADQCMTWALDVAKKSGLRTAAFFPSAAAMLVLNMSIPNLIADGVIDEEGEPKTSDVFQLCPEMHPIHTNQISWNRFDDKKIRKFIFNFFASNNEVFQKTELVLCNTIYELEMPALTYAPNILPVGPLLTGSRSDETAGNFWEQNTECIEWLDKQEENSVVYVAFGSSTILSQRQFRELAVGLELTGQPFLWVVRPGLVDFNDEKLMNLRSFMERVGDRGRTVGWSPQQQVLAHPSVACFISHCGWSSTLEGVRNGVPFLCWPYFCDQFFNQGYICDVWRVGLRIAADENNIYLEEEIRSKVMVLIGDETIKERSLALKDMARKALEIGGSSFHNFNRFVNLMKGI